MRDFETAVSMNFTDRSRQGSEKEAKIKNEAEIKLEIAYNKIVNQEKTHF